MMLLICVTRPANLGGLAHVVIDVGTIITPPGQALSAAEVCLRLVILVNTTAGVNPAVQICNLSEKFRKLL